MMADIVDKIPEADTVFRNIKILLTSCMAILGSKGKGRILHAVHRYSEAKRTRSE